MMAICSIRVTGWIYKMLLIVLGSALALIALFMLYFYDTGLEFGYYRQYYRARHVLESMPNVRIVAHWRNEDTVLEGFGFTLLLDGTREVQVNVRYCQMLWMKILAP